MKTTLDGVVFLLPHVSGHAKNGVSPQADFPRTERRARKRHAPFGRILPNPDGGAAERGGRTRRQNGAVRWTAGRGGRTGRRTRRQNRAAGRIGRTGRQDGAAEKEGGGRVIAADRSGGAARTNKKTGFQPPEAAGQRKSARRSGPASAKGQRTGSQYAVRTPGRVQYYPHGRR